MAKLSDKEAQEVKECFDLYDRTGSGKIPTNLLAKVVRSVGQMPSQAEIQDWIREIDPDSAGFFEYPGLVALLERHYRQPPAVKDIVDAFKIFDPDNTGKIASAELRTVMTNLGEKLSKEEVDAMIKEADPQNTGKIDYADFVKHMHEQTLV
jgi:calmodulin